MLRALARLALVGAVGGWVVDVVLAARRGRRGLRPIVSLAVIDAPPERVWARLVDVSRQPEWMTDLKSVRPASHGPIGVGSRFIGRVRILGIGVDDPVEVTAFDPPRRFAIRHDGAFTGSGTLELEPGADGTTTIVRWAEVLAPRVLPDLGGGLARPILQYVFQQDLHRLRRLVEAGA